MIAKTERILLRHFHAADLDDMAQLFADPEVMRFGRGPQSREWTREWLKKCLEDYFQKWGFGLWAVIHRPDRRLLGYCGLTLFDDVDDRSEIEIGYRLKRPTGVGDSQQRLPRRSVSTRSGIWASVA